MEKRDVQVFGQTDSGVDVELRVDDLGRLVPKPISVAVVGYQSLTIGASSVGLAGAWPAIAQGFIGVLETAQVRFRGDGTAPTATEGVVMEVGDQITLTAEEVVNMRFIRTTGISGILRGHYFDAEAAL